MPIDRKANDTAGQFWAWFGGACVHRRHNREFGLTEGGLTDGTISPTNYRLHAEVAEPGAEGAEKIFGPSADRSSVRKCDKIGRGPPKQFYTWPKALEHFPAPSA